MYLNASTDKIEIVLGGTVATNQLQWNVSYQDITSSGMTLPQSGGAGLTNNATAVDIVAAPAASTTRQVTQINVYNADTATATVTIQKDVSGTNYVLMRIALTTLDVLMWSREDGWRVMSATGGGTSYTFSTGLTNTSGTVTANLSTGVAGGQSVVGGTAASNSLTLSSTSNATKGKILFGTSAYDEVNNRLGIGTQSPSASMHSVVSAGEENIFADRYSTASSASVFIFRKANGTIASPTGLLSGDAMGAFAWRGYDGSAFTAGSRAAFIVFATENWSSTANGTEIRISNTTNGSTTNTERLRIFNSGNVFIGATPTDAGFRLDVNGTARVQTSLDTPIVRGGTGASGTLTLSSTSNATKGKILFGTSAYDEVNNRLGIGTASPAYPLDIVGDTFGSGHFLLNSALPNRHTQTVGFKGFWPGANSSFMASTAAGFEGFLLNSNLVRQPASVFWTCQDTTRPAWQIYCGYGSSAESLEILRAAATSGSASLVQYLRIAGSTGNLTIGTGADAGFRLDVNGTARVQGNLTISDTSNIVLATGTGTRIGTATTQKLGFWNAAPIAQPTTAVAAATRVGGGGTTLTDTDTFDGYTLAQVVKALRNAGLLA